MGRLYVNLLGSARLSMIRCTGGPSNDIGDDVGVDGETKWVLVGGAEATGSAVISMLTAFNTFVLKRENMLSIFATDLFVFRIS